MPVSSWRVLNPKSRSLPCNRMVSQEKVASVKACGTERKVYKKYERSTK